MHTKTIKKASTILFAAGFLAAHEIPAAIFTDFTSFDGNAETATGTLNGIGVLIQCTRAVSRPSSGDDGGVTGGTTDETSALFNFPVFTPALALGDSIDLGGASDFKITFAQPVTNLTLHIRQLEANRLSFTSGGAPVAFTILSSDGDFITSGNTALQGTPGNGDDASGSLFFAGVLSEISWTSAPGSGITGSTPEDGFRLQLSVGTEVQPQLNIAKTGAQQVRITYPTNHSGFSLESTTALPATSWNPVTNNAVIVGEEFSITVDASEPQRFFRLKKAE